MHSCIYCKSVKKVKISAADIIMIRNAYQAEELKDLFFLEETKQCYCMRMRFPSVMAGVRGQQAQSQNYDYFIRTMAEMMEKYAPGILE